MSSLRSLYDTSGRAGDLLWSGVEYLYGTSDRLAVDVSTISLINYPVYINQYRALELYA